MIDLTRKTAGVGLAALLATLVAGMPAWAQQEAAAPPAAADTLNIPADVKILGPADLGSRKATAIVNGTLITGTDVDQRAALYLAAQGAEKISAEELQRLRLEILRRIIDETLQIQQAKSEKHDVGKDEIDQAYAKIATEKFQMSPDALDKYLVRIGSSPQSLRRQIEGELAWDWLMRNLIAPFVNVSASEVNEMYSQLQASKGTAEYRVAEIFLSATPATHDAVAQNANKIVDQIKQGGNFAGFARQFSEASTASVGGDLGWIRLDQLQNPQLEQIAQRLNPGQLAGPLEIPGGFDIIYLVDKRQVGMADPRDALLSLKQISLDFPAGTSDADAQAKAATFQQAVAQIHGCGEAEAAATKIGAQVVANDQVRVRDLPDALQNIILQLNVGQATPPFGSLKEGVRVLMLCGRDDPQVAGGPNADQLMAQLEDDRIQKRAQRYLRDLRRDAVIEYN